MLHYTPRLNCLCLIHVLFMGSRQECSTSFLCCVLQLSALVCPGLQKLLLQNNQLSQLPEDLVSLQQLELILVDGNPMLDPPAEVCCQGTSGIWEYLQEKRHKKAMKLKVGVLRKSPCCTYKAVDFIIDPLQNNLQSTLCDVKNILN